VSNRIIPLFAIVIAAFGSSKFRTLMVNRIEASVYEKVKTKTHVDIVAFLVVMSSS